MDLYFTFSIALVPAELFDFESKKENKSGVLITHLHF